MHPLSFFPQLFTYALLAPFLLRIATGIFILFSGKFRYKKQYKWTAVIHVVTGILLIIGLYTQIAAILGLLVIAFEWTICAKEKPLEPTAKCFNILLLVILFSLLFTGPGFLAFDLPL